MPKFRKKPIEIEAHQWFEYGDHPDDGTKYLDGEGMVVKHYNHPILGTNGTCGHCGQLMNIHGWIDTIQGGHIVCPGDWIITDDRVKNRDHGYCYPCKPDIFNSTYEEV